MAVTIISYPDNQINSSIAEGTSLDSAELVKLVWVDLAAATTDEYVEIIYNGVTTTLYIQDECRYDPIDIVFANKSGTQQVLTFFKNKTENLTTTSEEFESDRNQPSAGNHQFVKYNVQGRTKFKVNSGFVDEDMNEIFEELIFSERVWSFVDNVFTPLDIKTTSLEFKTRQKQKLINYSINFEPSYNQINNI